MSTGQKVEAFPPMSPQAQMNRQGSSNKMSARPTYMRARKSSSLGADPRGDTGAGSLTTLTEQREPTSLTQTAKKQSKKSKGKGPLRKLVRLCFKNTWLLPLVVTLTLLSLYFVSPGEHNPLRAAIFLSYPNPPMNERTNTLPPHVGNVTQYGKGPKDFAFVAFYTVVLSFTREFLMQRVIRPIAIYYGIRGRNKQSRFMEQFYTAMYFAIFGPYGMYVMSRTPVWYFNVNGMYEGFPHRAHEALFKAYYLLQASYWAQQGLVLMLMLEKPRKDFKELVLHHIVTLALIGLSYRFHFTYIGIAVYITHDISDFFLASSKIFNYIDAWITPGYFVFFIGVWAYLRHYLNLHLLWSLLPIPGGNQFVTVGPYELDWATQQYKCWISQSVTIGLLATLQAVNIFWFVLILRILFRFLTQHVTEDVRSEGEDEDIDEDAQKPEVLVNGEPVSEGSATTSAVAVEGDAVKRKQ